MRQTVLVLGTNGRFGRAMAAAFHQKGWKLKLFARSKPSLFSHDHEFVQGDATNGDVLNLAAEGCAVIVNALSPPYSKWSTTVPQFTKNIIAAAESSGATILLPGNVYNFGENMPEILTESTPQNTTGQLGLIRKAMEESYKKAANDGIQTIILRGGDFIEREATGNWFDGQVISKIAKGRITYPGPLNCVHTWAYLPDMARAFVEIAEQRLELSNFETIGFPGYALTGSELVVNLEQASMRSLKVSRMPWPIVKLLSVFSSEMRGVVESSYIWRTPHQIDGKKFSNLVSGFIETPIIEALRDAISEKINVKPEVKHSHAVSPPRKPKLT